MFLLVLAVTFSEISIDDNVKTARKFGVKQLIEEVILNIHNPWSTSLALGAPKPSNTRWQIVDNDANNAIFVYSAFLETRRYKAIRIIGVTRVDEKRTLYCRLSFKFEMNLMIPARIQKLKMHGGYKYNAVFILCPLDERMDSKKVLNATVSVMTHFTMPPWNALSIIDTSRADSGPEERKRDNNVKVYGCVTLTHSNYKTHSVAWLLEWLEFQNLLGVNHLFVYAHKVDSTIKCILKYYETLGFITLLSWSLSIQEIRNGGQEAALNDCLYRCMSTADWIMPTDFDEVIVPRTHLRIQKMIASMQKRNVLKQESAAVSEFKFRHAFFYTYWPDDELMPRSSLRTMRKTRRWAEPQLGRQRGTYMVKPSDAFELGRHFVWDLDQVKKTQVVNTEEGLLHHYKVGCEEGSKCLNVDSLEDQAAQNWYRSLSYNHRSAIKTLRPTCLREYASIIKEEELMYELMHRVRP